MKDEDIKLPEMVNLTIREDWHNAIEEYARQAVRMNLEGDKSIIQQARAWELVHNALSTVKPGWYEGAETGQDAAVKTILDLGAKAASAQPKPSDPEPFDLARAMAGEPIVTRDGGKVKFLAHVPEASTFKVVVFVEGDIEAINLRETGRVNQGVDDSPYDLFMAPKPKRTVWVNVWKNDFGNIVASGHTTKEEALYCAQNSVTTSLMKKAHPIEIDA